ncbi:SRPBCC family protein [Vibrio fluvialis]|nr:SRPBCC family protein [Vibrio fluvialis]
MEFKEKIFINAVPEKIYPFYSNVNDWAAWDPDVTSSSIDGDFVQGTKGRLNPMKGPEAKIEFTEVTINKSFTTISRLPLCQISFEHELRGKGMQTEVIHAVKFSGFLAPLFGRLIGKQMKRALPATMKGLKQAVENGGIQSVQE